MNIKIVSFVFVSIILVAVSCNDNSVDPKPIEDDPLIPLNVGNYWLYMGYELEPDGSGENPHLEKFGFIIHNKAEQSINGSKISTYQMSTTNESLIPVDDSQWLQYGGVMLQMEKEFPKFSIV